MCLSEHVVCLFLRACQVGPPSSTTPTKTHPPHPRNVRTSAFPIPSITNSDVRTLCSCAPKCSPGAWATARREAWLREGSAYTSIVVGRVCLMVIVGLVWWGWTGERVYKTV